MYILVAVTSSEILKAKLKLGVSFNSNNLGGIDFTKFSELTLGGSLAIDFSKNLLRKV